MTDHPPLNLRLPTPGCYADADRSGLQAADVFDGMTEHLFYTLGKLAPTASRHDLYMALSYAVRDRLMTRYLAGIEAINATPTRVVAYLSAEFLIGPQLNNNLLMLGIQEEAAEALRRFGINDIDEILDVEEEPGLGNGGLGRLAACYLDSLATLQRPAVGYGIRYEFGIFDQEIRDGWQMEKTDNWLDEGNPWEIAKPELSQVVNWGGHTESYTDERGEYRVRWIPMRQVKGMYYGTPIQGYGVNTCNTLALWSAHALQSLALDAFNAGDYYRAMEDQVQSETVTKVLYPNDEPEVGKQLRLLQQYFFVSCSLQDILHLLEDFAQLPVTELPNRVAIQLNDTHPSIAVAELMRLLIDERDLEWDEAWQITVATLGYTNHTLLPEALETWPLAMFARFLPRHLELIYEINRRFLDEVRAAFPGDEARVRRMSIIGEDGDRNIRMAHLATVGSHAINGVAAMHSELVKTTILQDFCDMWPDRFFNKTNGVTPRRFVALANPGLRQLLDETIGGDWLTNLSRLRELEPLADDPVLQKRWREVKRDNKARLADYVRAHTGVDLNPDWMFDVQVKRIHEYKRQHLNALHIATLYHRIKHNPGLDIPPRAFVFGGKAAPGYTIAKLMIKLITSIGDTVNNDPEVSDRLRVAFIPNFNVQNGQLIYPAADLSEQISTAGKEASGTGNMKFMMNGALTIGTLDGANVEMREEAGAENFFLFGLDVDEVHELKARGYRPRDYIEGNAELAAVLGLIADGEFTHGDTDVFGPLISNLVDHDYFLVLADYADYVRSQDQVSATWRDTAAWTRMSILNSARSGKFSSDRSIAEYCDEIWNVGPVTVAD